MRPPLSLGIRSRAGKRSAEYCGIFIHGGKSFGAFDVKYTNVPNRPGEW